MQDLQNIVSLWQTGVAPSQTDTDTRINNKNTAIMNTIVMFENQEKKEKQNQVYAAIFLAALTVLLVYNVQLNISHFIGLILLIIGVCFNIIANRTDNFPDIRLLKTVDYLRALKKNTTDRTRMHRRNTLIGLIFLFPGCYLSFCDSFVEIGQWWLLLVAISGALTLYSWFKKYYQRSQELMTELTDLLSDFEPMKEKLI